MCVFYDIRAATSHPILCTQTHTDTTGGVPHWLAPPALQPLLPSPSHKVVLRHVERARECVCVCHVCVRALNPQANRVLEMQLVV